jgi:CubicO group peptidase (beta-lactamase class C family)
MASSVVQRAVSRRAGFADADRLIRTAVEAGELPGAALHVRAGGQVIHERAFGRRRVDRDAALRLDDIFPVASLTKPTVAVGVLRLHERGALRLDDPVACYLPEFADPSVLVRYDVNSGEMVTRPAPRVVTIRHLLTHTAGIHHGFPAPDDVIGTLYARAGVVHGDGTSVAEKVKRLGSLPLVHDPGEGWTYGLSSDVAGRVIEIVSGQSLDRYLASVLFEPLGMTSTWFAVPDGDRERLVGRHLRQTVPVVLDSWPEDGFASGGGGLNTTIGDYGHFVQMLLDGGGPVLSKASVALMTGNQIGHLTALGVRYGLSVGVATADACGEGAFPIDGFGWHGIYSTWFWTLPHVRGAVLLFGNVLVPGMNRTLFARVIAAAYAALLP